MVASKIGLPGISSADQIPHAFERPAEIRFIGHDLFDHLSQQIGAPNPTTTSDARQLGGYLLREPERQLGIGAFSHALHFALQWALAQQAEARACARALEARVSMQSRSRAGVGPVGRVPSRWTYFFRQS
jgi:hypothetical protein